MSRFNQLLLALSLLVVLIVGGLFYARYTERELLEAVTEYQADVHARLTDLARLSDQRRSNSAAAGLIPDCSAAEQDRLDSLLNRLTVLPRIELFEAKSLVLSCGAVPARSKAAAVLQLSTELGALRQQQILASILRVSDEVDLTAWERLLELESRRADLMREQLTLQLSIIDALIGGATSDSSTVAESLAKARQVAREYATLNEAVAAVQAELSI